jgi:UDP-2,4-diacetamido-2,4,6-trideoxy-beta-L-altropyranose hydrolase
VLASTDRWLFVAYVGHISVGSIRFDRLPDSSLEVSLYLDPELAGLGLGPCLLLAGEHRMRQIIGHDFLVEASVMPGNAVSQRLFGGCGYDGGPQRYRKSVTIQSSTGSEDS